jgi:protein-tyrosine phosphatase
MNKMSWGTLSCFHFMAFKAKNNTSDESASYPPVGTFDYQPEDSPWVASIRDTHVLDWCRGLNHEQIQNQFQIQLDLPVHIYGNVYLGNAASVENIGKLQRLGITSVLNMAGPFALKRSTIRAYETHGIVYKRISAKDDTDYPLLERHWKEAYEFLHTAQVEGAVKDTAVNNDNYPSNNIVVNCVAGINRSALVVAADYMVTCQKPVLEVVRHIRRQRGNQALSNTYFQEQLVALARQSNLLGDPLL